MYAYTGRKEETKDAMRELMTDKNEAVRLYGRLFIGVALGDLDEAFSALMKAGEMHSWPYLIGSLPIFEELRKDPRSLQFASKLGLPTGNLSAQS